MIRMMMSEKEYRNQQQRKLALDSIKEPLLLEEQRDVLQEYYNFIMAGGSKVHSDSSLRNIFNCLCYFGMFVRKPFNAVVRRRG
jgi:hypothetical protein